MSKSHKLFANELLIQELTTIENALDDFLDGSGGVWDWEDLILSAEYKTQKAEMIRSICAESDSLLPAEKKGQWCNENGYQLLKAHRDQLEKELSGQNITNLESPNNWRDRLLGIIITIFIFFLPIWGIFTLIREFTH